MMVRCKPSSILMRNSGAFEESASRNVHSTRQKIPGIYATATGSDVTAQVPKDFFAIVQNEIHRAIHGLTAAQALHQRGGAGKGNRVRTA